MATTKSKNVHVADDAGATANGAAPVRRLRLTPAWAGRDVSLEEFDNAIGQNGWRYELIDGRVEVFPNPELPHDMIVVWINRQLILYSEAHKEVIPYVTPGSRVFIPGRRDTTCPQPDVAAYRESPSRWSRQMRHWQAMKPILVVEVLSESYYNKDLVRNVMLYKLAPSVREYWILNPRDGGDHPTLRAYRKRGDRSWQKPIDVPFAGTYTTPLLPGFTLILDPSV